MFNDNTAAPLRGRRPAPILLAAAAALLVPLMLTALPREAASASLCARAHKTCISDCKRWAPAGSRQACYARCATEFDQCIGIVVTPAPEPFSWWRWKHRKHRHDHPKDPPKDPSKPPKPPKPPRPDNHVPPTGGTKENGPHIPPKPHLPPRANDSRPPKSGGVFTPKTSGAGHGAATSGASAPSSSSNGRH